MKKPLFIALWMLGIMVGLDSCKKTSDPQKEEDKKEQEGPKEEDENPNQGEGSGSVPLGKSFAGAASIDFKNENAVVDFFAGEHAVAIFRTPAGKDDEIGKGKVVISRDGNIFGIKLIGVKGTTLSEAKVDLTVDNDYNYETLSKPAAGRYIIGASERLNAERTQIDVYPLDNGAITGQIYKEGVLLYQFMNGVEYFGKTPPAAIVALKGTWEGPHLQEALCQPNIVNLNIATDGTITLKGKTALDCVSKEIVAKWDGQGDFVTANVTGWKGTHSGSMIHIDGYGSTPDGSVDILVPQLKDPTSLLEVQCIAGAAGNILAEPVKK